MSIREEPEIRQNYVEKLGNELGTIFFALYKKLSMIYLNWNEYCELFAKNAEQIDYLNEIAPHFFGTIQNVLLDDVILQIARFVDSPTTSGKQNLTIKMLPKLIDASLRDYSLEKIRHIEQLTAFCKEIRNRRIAHNDYLLSTDDITARPLPEITRKQIREVLAAIEDFMNYIQSFYDDSSVAYSNLIPPLGGSAALIHHLRMLNRPNDMEPLHP